MRDYELMVVLDPNLDEASIEAANARITSVVNRGGGSVENVEAWGRRRLAYPIGRHRDGTYTLLRLRMNAESATEVERSLKLTESVMRHLLVRPLPSALQAAHAPAPLTAPAPAAAPAPAEAETAAAAAA